MRPSEAACQGSAACDPRAALASSLATVLEVSTPLEKLQEAERELANLAAYLETVVPAGDEYRVVALALGHRARSLFLAFRHLAEGPAPAAAPSLVRPMVEINLVLRFLGKNPELHVELWHAEGERQHVALLDEYAKDAELHHRHSPLPEDLQEQLDATRTTVREARAKALSAGIAGVRKTGPVFPSIADIVKTTDDPGAREAYTLAYRALGTSVHIGPLSFRLSGFQPHVGGLVSYTDQWTAEELRPTRTLVLTTFASTLCIVSVALALNVDERADEIKQMFMVEEPPIAERIARELEALDGEDGGEAT
jgi:hypothetical protein